jgi:negative regulator of flagellin synthesis FlgM
MEVTMSFSNGIGSLPQTTNPITPTEAKPAKQTVVSGSLANQNELQTSNVEHADQTNLSSTAGLVAQVLEGSDIRSAKVASLQQAIAAGTYSVSPSDVADKIIQSLLD